jgi:hypothetical protein
VAYANHPDTGRPYEWPECGPLEVKPEDIPLITAEQAKRICDHFEEIAFDMGWTPVGVKRERLNGSGDFSPLAGVMPKTDLTVPQIKERLGRVAPLVDDYDSWVEVGMALHHQFDDDSEGRDLWDDWSAQGVKFSPAAQEAKWRSFDQVHAGGSTTFATALKRAKELHKEERRAKIRETGFRLVPIAEVRAKPGPIAWLVQGLIEKDTVGALFGDPASYKSSIALDMAVSIASGRPFHGRPVRQGPVIYLASEGHGGIARRLAAWERHHGQTVDDLEVVFSDHAAAFSDPDSAAMVAEAIEAVVEIMGPPALIVIDTIARNFGPGDENSNSDMGVFLNAVTETLQARGQASTVLLVLHTGHGAKNRARGGSALHAGVDFEFRTERKGGMRVQVTNTKMKDAVEPQPFALEAREVFVGEFDQESDATSLVLTECALDVTEETRKRPTGSRGELLELIEREGPVRRDTLRDLALDEKIYTKLSTLRMALK